MGLKKALKMLAQYFHTSSSSFGCFYFEALKQILSRTSKYEDLIRSTVPSEKEADAIVREVSRVADAS